MKICSHMDPDDFGEYTRRSLEGTSPGLGAVQDSVWLPIRWLGDIRNQTQLSQLFLAPSDKGV